MKKFTLIGLVIVLLAFSAIPVFAAGSNNGHGHGNGSGQTSMGDQSQTRQQDRDQTRNDGQGKFNHGSKGFRNQASNRARTPFYLQGIIKSINTGNHTVTITVFHGNARVKGFIGKDIVITITGTTQFFKVNQGDESEGAVSQEMSTGTAQETSTGTADEETNGERVSTAFSQLAAKDIVAIHGNLVGTVYNATVVSVYTKLAGIQPGSSEP